MRSVSVTRCVLPLQFKAGDSWETLGLKGDEIIAIGESETGEFTTGAGSDKHSRTSMSIGIGIGL